MVNLEDKIGGLEQDLKNKVAQNKIELENAYKADQANFANKYLTENSLVAVAKDKLNELEESLEEATTKMADNVRKAVEAATSSMKKDHENANELAKMTFERTQAENTAKLTQMEAQVKFLSEQVGYWKQALEEERKAGVERAKAASIGTLNVGGVPR